MGKVSQGANSWTKSPSHSIASVQPSMSENGVSTSLDEEEIDLSVFSKLQSWQEPPGKAQIFDQLEADDTLALEGPVMNDFGDYMTLKRKKTRRQYLMSDQVGSQDLKASKTLFSGLTAFISTSIYIEQTEDLASQQQAFMIDFKYLSRIWVLHGGTITQNVNSGQLTHYINSFLPIYFLRDLDKMKSKMALVTPHWVLSCIAQNKKLPTLAFALNVVNADGVSSNGQQRINFASAANSSASTHSSKDRGPDDSILSAPMHDESIAIESRQSSHPPSLHPPECPPIAIEDDSEDDIEYEEPADAGGGPQHRMQTSAENPNFVADYFSSSRLHHLSSWKIKFQEELELYLASTNKSPSTGARPAKSTRNTSSSSADRIIDLDGESAFRDASDDSSIFVHIDMDAFFASVATRKNLALREKPVVISHGGSRALCPSVNYEARKLGIHNGTPLGDAMEVARAAGKELIVLPYDYAEYEVVSRQAHEIFLQFTSRIHIKSVDEAVLDLTGTRWDDVIQKVSEIRRRVFEATNCSCSAGIGSTVTLARFALMKAKPNGLTAAPTWKSLLETETDLTRANAIESLLRVLTASQKGKISGDEYHRKMVEIFEHGALEPKAFGANDDAHMTSQPPHQASQSIKPDSNCPITFLSTFQLRDMPGIGWKTRPKFGDIKTIGALQQLTLAELRQRMGHKIGANLYLTARGIDSKLLSFDGVAERKTISVDLTYGVRFHTNEQFYGFIKEVSKELSARSRKVGRAGKTITVKLWVRHPDAKPTSFLGHGKANTFSRSAQLPSAVMDAETMSATAERLIKEFHVPPAEIRGFGLSLSALSKPTPASHSITSMFKAALKSSTAPPLPNANSPAFNPSSRPVSPAPEPPQVPLEIIDLDTSLEKSSVILIEAEAPKKDKKRMRTINSLMEKALEKSSKKSKKAVEAPKKLKEVPRKEEIRVTLFESFTPVVSTRVVAYAPVDLSMLRDLENWVKGREVPSPVHGELLFQFSITLLETRNLEDLYAFSRRLNRIGAEHTDWAIFTGPIIDRIQTWMKTEFGSPLLL